MARRRTVGACAVVGALLAAGPLVGACGESKWHYVDNGKENTYIRVPNGWKVFTIDSRAGRPASLPDSVESVWHIAFDASAKPSLKNVTALDALPPASVDKPVGQLEIFQVTGTFNQQLSLTTARSSVLGIDPSAVPDDVKDLVEIDSTRRSRTTDSRAVGSS